jgi:hypothetical protein
MLQDDSPVVWDSIYVHRDPSTAVKVYVLFSLVAILVTATRLIALWMAAPPFRLSRQAINPAYLRQLQASRNGWGLRFSDGVWLLPPTPTRLATTCFLQKQLAPLSFCWRLEILRPTSAWLCWWHSSFFSPNGTCRIASSDLAN